MLFPSQNHTKKIVKNGEYVKVIQVLQPLLRDWENSFDNAKCMVLTQQALVVGTGTLTGIKCQSRCDQYWA